LAGKTGHRGWGWLRRRASGRWQASYIGPDLARHYAPSTYSARMDGEAWLAAERRLIELDQWTSPKIRSAAQTCRGISVADYLHNWIAQRANIGDGTRYAYQNNLRVHIAPKPLGALPLSALTPEAVRSWYATMDATKPTARAAVYRMLRSAMNTATADGVFAKNPAIIQGASTQTTTRQAVILTVPELAELADGMPERLRAWVLIAGWCGLRVGEALELRRSDISEDCSVISVSRGHRHVGGRCIIKSTKSGKPRTVVVPPHIRADLKHHLDAHTAEGADALLFPPSTTAKKRCHLDDYVLRHAMRPVLARIGKPTMVIHDLRHFCGTQTARCGNLVETMSRLGHSTVRASMIYQQVASGRDAEIADALSALHRGEHHHK
jgi:integrase